MINEFTQSDCEKYANHFMAKHLEREWEFIWSNKMTRAFGYCYSNHIIKLSVPYFNLNKAFPHIIRNIILHEIAHAMQYEQMGYISHDKHWKNYCLKIGTVPEVRFSHLDVTVPCNSFALRNKTTGKVLNYMNILRKKNQTILTALKYLSETIDNAGEENHEVIWCGK
jgi:hypothetical protein